VLRGGRSRWLACRRSRDAAASSGAVKILAVSTAARSALLPGIPTLRESGIDVEATPGTASLRRRERRTPIVGEDRRELRDHHRAEHPHKLATQLMKPIPGTPKEFRARIDADLARWAPVIRAANIRVN